MSLAMQGSLSSYLVSYIFIGNLPQQLCQKCIDSQGGSIYYNGTCVKSCPVGSYLGRVRNNG